MINNFSSTSLTPLLSPSSVAESRASANTNTPPTNAARLSSSSAVPANVQARSDDASIMNRANALLTQCHEEQSANPGFSKERLRAFVEARNDGEWTNATNILSELLSINNNTRSQVKKAGAVDAMGGLFMSTMAAIFPAYVLSQDHDSLTENTETNAAISFALALLLPLITSYVNAGTELLGGAIQERILADNPSLQPAKLSNVSASTTAHPDPLKELSAKLNQFEETIRKLNKTKQYLIEGKSVGKKEIDAITTELQELLIEKDKSSTAYQLKKEIQDLTTTGQQAQIYWRLLGVLTSLASLTGVNKDNPYISPAITVGYTMLSFIASPLLGSMDADHKFDQMLAIVAKNIALKAEDGREIDLDYLSTSGANMEKINVPELQALLPQPTMAKFALFKERLEYEIWKAERAPDTTPPSPRSNLPATARMPRHDEVLKQDLNKLNITEGGTDQWSQVSIGTLRELCAFMESDSPMTKAWSITRARIMTRAKYVPEVAQRFSSNLQILNFGGGLLPNLTLATLNTINAAEKNVAATTPQDPAISPNANIVAMTVLLVSNAIWTALYPDRIRTKAETRTALGLEEDKYGTPSAQFFEGLRASLAQWNTVLPQAFNSLKAKLTVWQSQALPDTLGKKGSEIQLTFSSNARQRMADLDKELKALTATITEMDKTITSELASAEKIHSDAKKIDITIYEESADIQMKRAKTAATTAEKMQAAVSAIIKPTEQSQLDQLEKALSDIQTHLKTAENAVSKITLAQKEVNEKIAELTTLKGKIPDTQVPNVEKKETEERNLGERITNQHTVLSELNTSLNKLLAETGNHSDTQQSSQDISWKLDTEPLNRAVKKTVANAEDLQKMIDKARELTEEKIKETNEKFKNIEMDFDSAKESLKRIATAVTNVTRQLDNARKNFKKTKNNSAEEQA